jgi:ABC-type multidrug transport system ATPase subunit
MSTQRIERLEVRAFKAFKNLDFKLDGRHLLAYGGNGAGKSSLYWTLYTFLQSAAKDTPNVAKYFDESGPQSLLNVHAAAAERAIAAVVVSIKDHGHTAASVYSLSIEQHDTKANPDVLKASLASDFITYRVLSSFYQFRNSQAIDLWPVFEQEILPFAQGASTKDVAALWNHLKTVDPFVQSKAKGETNWYRKQRYDRFDRDVIRFNIALDEVLASITTEAQRFYNEHFAESGTNVVLKVGVTAKASKYDRYAHRFSVPSVGFEIKLNGDVVRKPQSFLNEAKLTQLALSVRFGATLAHLHDSPLKLLVLDDLLISLDMNNRMKVVDIILSETFAEHQKIILTHDLGFFNEFRRRIGSRHSEWSFQRFVGSADTEIRLQEDKNQLQKAEEYLHGESLDEAANCIRKAAEDTARRFRELTVVPTKEFITLTEQLRWARNKLLEKLPTKLYENVLNAVPEKHREYLVPDSDADLAAIPAITPEELATLSRLRKRLRKLVTNEHWAMMANAKVIDDLLATTERVLNPGSHGGEAPLYKEEVRQALVLVKKLEQCLS